MCKAGAVEKEEVSLLVESSHKIPIAASLKQTHTVEVAG